MAELRIGTCSWKYDSWKDIVYSEHVGKNHLAEYSNKYNTVEIDQWFWSLFGESRINLPNPKIAEEYASSVPEDFRFSIKLPNSLSLTHYYKENKTDALKSNPYFLSPDLYNQILYNLKPLQNLTGPLMLQFEYLNKQKMSTQIDFQIRLKSFLENINPNEKLAVEIRNPNYLNSSFFDFLNEQKLIPVLLQGYYMPPVFEIFKKFKGAFGGTVVIRLHGPDRKGIEEKSGGDWSKIIEPKDSELRKIVEVITELLGLGVDVYLNVNNHYEGSAPLTIEKIKKLI